jgi:hypothetical protein
MQEAAPTRARLFLCANSGRNSLCLLSRAAFSNLGRDKTAKAHDKLEQCLVPPLDGHDGAQLVVRSAMTMQSFGLGGFPVRGVKIMRRGGGGQDGVHGRPGGLSNARFLGRRNGFCHWDDPWLLPCSRFRAV